MHRGDTCDQKKDTQVFLTYIEGLIHAHCSRLGRAAGRTVDFSPEGRGFESHLSPDFDQSVPFVFISVTTCLEILGKKSTLLKSFWPKRAPHRSNNQFQSLAR